MRLASFATSLVLSFSTVLAQGWVDRTAWNGPPPRSNHAMCYDPGRGYVVMFGGRNASSAAMSDTWTRDGVTWTQRANGPSAPSYNGFGLTSWAMSYHPPTSEVLLVIEEGSTQTGTGARQSYTWNGAAWVARGALPNPSSQNGIAEDLAMAFDPLRGQTVLYGRHNNYWPYICLWDGVTWSAHTLPTVPQPGCSTTMAWDPAATRVILVTGAINNCGHPVRLYEWTGLNWQQRLPAHRPSDTGAMATDPLHSRVVMFDSDYQSLQPNHTWTIANGVFTQVNTPSEPSLRRWSAMAFDAGRGLCVLFGGANNSPMGDTWEFDLGIGASYTAFSGGCLGSRGTPHIVAQGNSIPRVGTTFTLQANNLPWTGPVFLFLGLSDASYGGTPLPFDLVSLGAPNCNVLCSGDDLHVLPNILGSGVWTFLVPPAPGATFYNQVFALDPAANALGLTVSNGGRGVIGM